MKTVKYTYKGKEVIPLTHEQALTLDRGDKLKFIGPGRDPRLGTWTYDGRRPFVLWVKPVVSSTHLRISGITYLLKEIALLERGDPSAYALNKVKRFVPFNLKAFRKDISSLLEDRRSKIDKHLNELPLHKRLEFFRQMSPQDKAAYDALYKDIEVLLGLKEENETVLPS